MSTDQTKLGLSAKELALVRNTDFILTKQRIIQKVVHLFGAALLQMQAETQVDNAHLPEVVFERSPKIAKGENYKCLPYVMLDYPRYFDKANALAIRTFFWWGNHFSMHLQLAGSMKVNAMEGLINNFIQLQQQGYWICVSTTPWEHHFEEENYRSIDQLQSSQFIAIIREHPFVKIGKQYSLLHWDTATLFIQQTFKEMLLLLEN